jgi:hypothetical protein
MRKMLLIFVLLFLLFSSIWSQEITGNLEGRILDRDEQPILGAEIGVSSPALQGTRETTTGPQGYFRFFALPSGKYTIKIEHPDYQEKMFQNVLVRLGKTSPLGAIRLKMRFEEAHEVVVVAEKPVIDLFSTTLGANLSSSQYELLPVERDYRSLVTLLPQVNQSFLGDEANFAGATGLENKYFIDGVEVTDPFRGISSTNLPYNFVREIESRTGGYQAEYRSSLGGVVNVVTYSGGEEFHGQLFGFFVNNRFSEAPRQGALEVPRGDFSQYDFGISLGGPILRDKLWFFGAYNPDFEHEDVLIPGSGFSNDHKTTHNFAGKLSWRINASNNLVFTVFGDPAKRQAIGETFGTIGVPSAFANPDPYLSDIKTGGTTFSLKGIHFINKSFFLETSISRATYKYRNLPTTERGRSEVLFIDAQTGIWSGGVGMRVDTLSTITNVGLKGTLFWGRHTLKAGFEYLNKQLRYDEKSEILTMYAPDFYFDFFSERSGIKVANRIPSLFIQDSWRLSEKVHINAGLRWDGQFWVGSDGKVAQKISDQFQPRTGFIYQPGQPGTQKIYASFGRFYQELSTDPVFSYAAEYALRFWYYDHDPRTDPSGGYGFEILNAIQPEIKGLKGQYYDEYSLGYERLLFNNFKLGIGGVYRKLREGLENAFHPDTGEAVFGNPGRGKLIAFPRMKRQYAALEVTLEKMAAKNFSFLASYVFSRNYGNYMGLFNSDFNYPFPNSNGSFDRLETLMNGTGLLPNDRTHVFKLSGFYRFHFGLTAGTWIIWQSGTPLNEFGGSTIGPPSFIFLRQRGTAGRTPSIFDLNLRLTYDLARLTQTKWQPRLIADIFHIGSQRKPVNFEQVHYFNQDPGGNQINPNPIYGRATHYHPPMSMRLGIEVNY